MEDPREQPWLRRILMYVAHSLILFNFWGIPLAFGPFLEYSFNVRHRNVSLLQLSSPIALQICLIFVAPAPIAALYNKGFSRLPIALASLGTTAVFFLLPKCQYWWHDLLLQGAVLGMCLGVLGTMSMLLLASHYRNYIMGVVTFSSIFGFLGGIIYTLIPFVYFRTFRFKTACYITGGITSFTLFFATILVRKSLNPRFQILESGLTKQSFSFWKEKGTLIFMGGYVLICMAMFTLPTFSILLATLPKGSHTWPVHATISLLSAYAAAILPAAHAANHKFKYFRFGLLNAFIVAAILGGLCYPNLAWMPFLGLLYSGLPVYGLCLGVLVTSMGFVTGRFHYLGVGWYVDMPVRMAGMLALGGVAGALGIILTAALAEYGGGFEVAFTVMGNAMVVGGSLVAVARCLRCGWRVFVVI
ncbi:hypothetical protein CC78DRAFT_620162 [Lojkania enalia]|uniref:MFS transporter n=1 Tax=Lojkania enalia TaxID=147567 RepID=A0A9P4K0Y4_9PLEO|nr:hypothetical protein CC78DRAFT_620162 [Didymosphaeria enalia]